MKKLQQLHEQFISMANRPMTLGGLPITPRQPDVPVIAVDRWKESNGALYKTYRFRCLEDRTRFVMGLLAYESSCEHCANINISHDTVNLRVQTKDIDRPTEIDREYARYCDVLFKDLVYDREHGTEG